MSRGKKLTPDDVTRAVLRRFTKDGIPSTRASLLLDLKTSRRRLEPLLETLPVGLVDLGDYIWPSYKTLHQHIKCLEGTLRSFQGDLAGGEQ